MKALKKPKKTHKPSTKYFINPSSAQARPWWGLCTCNKQFPLLSKTRLCEEEVPHQLEGIGDLSLMLASTSSILWPRVAWHYLPPLDGRVPYSLSAG